MIPRAAAGLIITTAVILAPSATPAAGPCSTDAFVIDGVAVGVEVCDRSIARAAAKSAQPTGGEVRETLLTKGRAALVRSVRYERLGSEETARTLDDIPLQALGIEKTMHVTIAVRDGSARLEHALLVPGAVSLK